MPVRAIENIDQLKTLIGQELGSSDWVTVDQSMIDAFASVTGDHQWIHVDAERAKNESIFGRTIAPGFLTLSLLSRFSREALRIGGDFRMRLNYGLNRVRFTAPVPEGSRVRGKFTLQAVEDIARGYQIVWLASVELEGSAKPALIAEWLVRFYR